MLPSFRQLHSSLLLLLLLTRPPSKQRGVSVETTQALGMEGASTTHKEEDDGHAPRLLDAPVKIQDQEGNDQEGLDFMWGTDKV